ncbi:hypothetical protein DTO021D3_4475 [Paecilomyces variotii]|nr:hypothetical protein DTO032I3_3594 [Paecilomyces variotii]KAJ9278566.1 hypothetical protein DTO021D3_4475 [Paecilomyces variotii]KAJ9344540.1 hypothetical protein DTO027B6_2722 [Paecilomyces variotii]KAJ9380172.1 hypothetical protein DTO032I4_6862 [Paecilomyces variotii]
MLIIRLVQLKQAVCRAWHLSATAPREDGCLSSHSKDRKIRHRYYLLSFSVKLTNYCNTDEKARTSQIVKTRNRECEDSPLAP